MGLAGESEARFLAMTPPELRAYEIDLMRRIADLALVPPTLNTHPLPKYDCDQLDYGMNIGFERTPKGRLWAAWVAGEDGPKAFMVAATSSSTPAICMLRQNKAPIIPIFVRRNQQVTVT